MSSKKWIWNILLTVMTLIGMLCGTGIVAMAQEQRVFDQAELFSAEEREQLEEQIAGIKGSADFDMVIVTTADAQGKSARVYADDFYDEGGFGIGTDADGILFLIDMDNREIYLSTAGAMQRYLTDSRVEAVLDHAYEHVQQGDYAKAAAQALGDTVSWYRRGIPGGQYLYDEETGRISRHRSIRWYEFLFAFFIAAFCGIHVCAKVSRDYGMKQERQRAAGYHMAYRADAAFSFRKQTDVMTGSFINQHIIARSTSGPRSGFGGGHSGGGRSTVHRSGAGRSHGGGGRRF